MTPNNISEKAYTVSHSLDLRGVRCPMSFVRTKVLLDTLERESVLEVLLDAGESAESVGSSVQAEGHVVIAHRMIDETHARLVIQKL
jgi:TusA-related sulfurtransferase